MAPPTIAKLRILVLSLLFFSPVFFVLSPSTAFAGSYYVDNASVGSATGQSWANAWKSFADVKFSSMSPGDTLYISGGSTSKTYTGTLTVPAGTQGITITKGTDAGHNGEVIFNGQGNTQYGINLSARGTPVKNIYISNLTFRAYTWAGVFGDGEHSGGLQGITVDNVKVYDFKRAGIFFTGDNNVSGNYNILVKNSYLDDEDGYTGQSDGIYIQSLVDFTADHNYIILDNNYTGVADVHSDNIQSFWVDNIMYSNNIVVQKSDKTLGTQMLFTTNGYGEHVLLNNVFIRDCPYAIDSAINLKNMEGSGSTFTGKVIGNTYYGKGRILASGSPVIIKNNIFYGISEPEPRNIVYTAQGGDISNNIFYDPNNQFPNDSGGVDVDPKFVNASFTNPDFHLQSNSPAINAGANLNSYGTPYSLDIDNKSRGSTWDIGAYEYSNSTSPTPTPTNTPKPGDANNDGKVDGIDYVIWLNHYNQTTNRGYLDGDFNNNSLVDGVDYVLWLNSYGIM